MPRSSCSSISGLTTFRDCSRSSLPSVTRASSFKRADAGGSVSNAGARGIGGGGVVLFGTLLPLLLSYCRMTAGNLSILFARLGAPTHVWQSKHSIKVCGEPVRFRIRHHLLRRPRMLRQGPQPWQNVHQLLI